MDELVVHLQLLISCDEFVEKCFHWAKVIMVKANSLPPDVVGKLQQFMTLSEECFTPQLRAALLERLSRRLEATDSAQLPIVREPDYQRARTALHAMKQCEYGAYEAFQDLVKIKPGYDIASPLEEHYAVNEEDEAACGEVFQRVVDCAMDLLPLVKKAMQEAPRDRPSLDVELEGHIQRVLEGNDALNIVVAWANIVGRPRIGLPAGLVEALKHVDEVSERLFRGDIVKCVVFILSHRLRDDASLSGMSDVFRQHYLIAVRSLDLLRTSSGLEGLYLLHSMRNGVAISFLKVNPVVREQQDFEETAVGWAVSQLRQEIQSLNAVYMRICATAGVVHTPPQVVSARVAERDVPITSASDRSDSGLMGVDERKGDAIDPSPREATDITGGLSQNDGEQQKELSGVVRGSLIGKGWFGAVYKGTWNAKDVAMKYASPHADAAAWEREVLLVCSKVQRHCNVVDVHGIFDGAIVMELAIGGDLFTWVRKKFREVGGEGTMEVRVLLQLLRDVALGMAHVHECGVFHGDLALRNVLLFSGEEGELVAKITDFGLAHVFHDDSSFSVACKQEIPVCESALEVLTHGMVSKEADVWSFGVLAWQLFSGGENLYDDVEDSDMRFKKTLANYLKRGKRLERPDGSFCAMPDAMWELTQSCWQQQWKRRPSFDEIIRTIDSLLQG